MLINTRKILRIGALALSSIMISNSGIAVADVIKNMNNPVEYSILADLNKDGELNYKDYTTIEDFILGKIDLMPYNERFGLFELGDLNGDFDITSTDQAILNRYLNGMINNFEVEEKIIKYIADKTVLLYEGQELKLPETIKATMYNNSKKDMQVIWNVKDLNFNEAGEYKVTGIVNGYNKEVNLNVIVNDYNPNSNVISGVVDGIEKGDKAIITIGNDSYLKTIETDERGIYQLNDVPNGEYFVKIDLSGYKLQQTKNVTVSNSNGTTKGNTYSNVGQANFEVEEFTDNQYKYHWEQDDTVGGYEESANIVNRPKIEFLDKEVVVGDSNSANKLLHNYNIILSDEEISWTQEYAQRFWETIESIPQDKSKHNGIVERKPSKWILTERHIDNDIEIEHGDKGDIITISKDAFINAKPRLAEIEGVKGKYYSKKLHFALTRYITNEGNDLYAVEKILNTRFGVTTMIPNYEELTLATTQEDQNRFQAFKPEELLYIINMFEEMPQGLHVVNGLKYLVRRADGMPHPLYPTAPAVAWPDAMEESYIEFMDSAFIADDSYIHKLIIHEKAHFIWSNLLNDEIKSKWIEIGGWYENPDDKDGWSTTKTTEFVSDYAHGINPNEDMAETISYYIVNPDKLKSRSINKYNFVRDYIMHGDIYISQIREDLTFEVFNLYPDYNYPGKIKRVDISVDGKGDEDKTVTVEIELNILNKVFDGASSAYTRIYSDIDTFYDLSLAPINEEGSILRGQIQISKYSKSGYWYSDQIVVTDSVGNQRFEGVNDYGWKLYINNEKEDVTPPQYIANSLNIEVFKEEIQGRDVNKLNVTWRVEEDNLMRGFNGVFAHLINKDTNQDRIDKWGSYEFENEKANVDFYLTEYMPSGNYGVPYINIVDEAGNSSPYYFSDSELDEKMKTVEIISSNPDTKAPEIDINKIYVKATPTKPEAPDGETLVEITYYARDDKSGLGEVSYILRDPQGIGHREYHYHENFGTLFFEGDPTAWKEYKISVVLPRGSAPGIWGLEEINIIDKARNRKNYNFTENIHFEVGTQGKSISNYGLQVGLGNNTALQGEEVILPIYINNIPEGGVNNLNIAIEYDKKSLELIEVTKGDIIYNSDDLKYNLSEDKKIHLVFNDTSQGERTLYGSGNIAYLKFKVNENTKKGEQIIAFYNDSLRVQDAANVRLEKLEIENYEGKVDIQGYAKADIDCNNSIDIADLAKVALKYNKDNTSEQWDNKLDFNDDKIIDIFDLIYVSKNI